MTVSSTLAGVFLKGAAAARPAANAVAGGTVYSATDTGVITQSDGSSWSTWATISTGIADPTTTRGDLLYRGAASLGRLALGAAGKALISDGTDAKWGVPTVPTSENFLTGNVTMTTAGTFYDGPSLSLVAGTYLLMTKLNVYSGSPGAGNGVTGRLWDGTTIYDSAEGYDANNNGTEWDLVMFALVTLGSTTTVKASATGTQNGYTIRSSAVLSGTANKMSHLIAAQVAP